MISYFIPNAVLVEGWEGSYRMRSVISFAWVLKVCLIFEVQTWNKWQYFLLIQSVLTSRICRFMSIKTELSP